ncbi:MAG: DUF3575 domain-containing protein [Muribaculaceae bacterium]|nr:DUF3575 domain-containing protein [Muribaculaceae bacterium]
MEKFIENLAVSVKSGNIDRLVVHGYASPEGPFTTNDRLSTQRCNVIAEYLSAHAGVPVSDIQTYPGGVAWTGLRDLVLKEAATPSREAVLKILDEYGPEACTNRIKSNQCRKSLMELDGGSTYNWLLDNLFPRLRYSLAVFVYRCADVATNDSVVENEAQAYTDTTAGTILPADTVTINPTGDVVIGGCESVGYMSPPPLNSAPLHRLAIKTNLLYDAALLPNIEVEYRINSEWSVALEGGVAWWGKYSHQRSYRLALVSPEVKRWIHPKAPWHGLYVGAFTGAGLYDFEKPSRGYRGEGVMAGISVGYMWTLKRNLSFEAAVGAGYLFTRYKEYKPMHGHHVYQRTKDLNYFGPLKLKFSIVWRLWDQNNHKRQQNSTIAAYEN